MTAKEYSAKQRKALEGHVSEIREHCRRSSADSCSIGYHLAVIRNSSLYLCADSKTVYEFAETVFGFKTSTTKNLIQVCEVFSVRDEKGNITSELQEQYSVFSYTQLVAMLSLSDDERQGVTPDMTVSQIKALYVSVSDKRKKQSALKFGAEGQTLFEGYVSVRTWDSMLDKLHDLVDSEKKIRILVFEPDITEYAAGLVEPVLDAE